MAQEDPSPFREWLDACRGRLPELRGHLAAWWHQFREDPAALWQIARVRYGVYIVGGALLMWLASAIGTWGTPPTPEVREGPRAVSADFHVICSDAACAHHFAVHREFGFRKFPVACPKCEQTTGYGALRCASTMCQGRWVVPIEDEGTRYCPQCDQPFP